jgi:hypothetical protein
MQSHMTRISLIYLRASDYILYVTCLTYPTEESSTRKITITTHPGISSVHLYEPGLSARSIPANVGAFVSHRLGGSKDSQSKSRARTPRIN